MEYNRHGFKKQTSIKEIVQYMKSHFKEDYDPFVYGYTFLFLVITVTVNYWLDFEDAILDSYMDKPVGPLYFFLYFSFAYYGIAIPRSVFTGKGILLKKRDFWIKSSLFVLLISFASSFYFNYEWLDFLKGSYEQFFIRKILVNLKGALFYIVPLLIIRNFFDKNTPGLYGLATRGFKFKPYLFMLLIVFPIICLVSFLPDFLKQYPSFKPWLMIEVFSLKKWELTAIFEMAYAFNFIMVELIFRGALVIGMATVMGKDAILPMVATYAFLHFGKPLGETIGSVIGGYILGVIALYSRNILGGCLIHIGVAYLMEYMAMFQYYVLKDH